MPYKLGLLYEALINSSSLLLLISSIITNSKSTKLCCQKQLEDGGLGKAVVETWQQNAMELKYFLQKQIDMYNNFYLVKKTCTPRLCKVKILFTRRLVLHGSIGFINTVH